MSALLSPRTGRDNKGAGCGERKQEVERKRAGLGGLSGPVGILPFNFVVVCTPSAFLE